MKKQTLSQKLSLSPQSSQISPKIVLGTNTLPHSFSNKDFALCKSSLMKPNKDTLNKYVYNNHQKKVYTQHDREKDMGSYKKNVRQSSTFSKQQNLLYKMYSFSQFQPDCRAPTQSSASVQPQETIMKLLKQVTQRQSQQKIKRSTNKSKNSIPQLFIQSSFTPPENFQDASPHETDLLKLLQQLQKMGNSDQPFFNEILQENCKSLIEIAKQMKKQEQCTHQSERERNNARIISVMAELDEERKGRLKLEEQAYQMISSQEREIQFLEKKIRLLEQELQSKKIN